MRTKKVEEKAAAAATINNILKLTFCLESPNLADDVDKKIYDDVVSGLIKIRNKLQFHEVSFDAAQSKKEYYYGLIGVVNVRINRIGILKGLADDYVVQLKGDQEEEELERCEILKNIYTKFIEDLEELEQKM
jgi:hypothetical protein